MVHSWLKVGILEKLVQWEIYVLLVMLFIFAYGFYKFLLKSTSFERHRNIRKKLKSLLNTFIFLSIFFAIFEAAVQIKTDFVVLKALPYIGLIVLVFGCTFFIQVCRLFILMYFFLVSMGRAVPILLVNILTLLLSLFFVGWIFTSLFGVQVGPLLATSAAFSIILGLALQDTLGNLFAGISLQLDNVFEIGNWVEVVIGGQKIIGQISEISWRSVNLIGFAEDVITIPNRILAQSQISNWTRPDSPIIRSQSFRISYGEDIEKIKNILKDCVHKIPAIKNNPQPIVVVTEMNESCLIVKLVYFIDNYGSHFVIGDEVINACLKSLANANIKIATQVLEIRKS